MPGPKIFKTFSSKTDASKSGPAPDVSTNFKGGDPQEFTVTSDNAAPTYPDSLKEAWGVVHQELPQAQGVEKLLNSIAHLPFNADLERKENTQDALSLSPGQRTAINALAAPAKALMDTRQVAEAIHKGVDAFMEAVPPLIKALDEVAKIHPFISLAVLAFKAVYTLELKRRENDKRVLVLYVEMKDMMAVLVQLNGLSDPKKIAPDGQTIEGRMQKLCEDVAKDIRKCANACDTYLKKKVLVKVLAGPIWEGRLLEFVGVFTKRRAEFEFALTVHATAGVDVANLKLDSVNERTAELSRRMDIMLQLFQEFVTPQQQTLAVMVQKMGGNTVLEDKQAMKELAGAESALSSEGGHCRGRSFDFVELQQEIKGDPDEAIAKNAQFFDCMFDIQRRQIAEDVARTVNREGDRIISAVTAGPHDRIVDPDIYSVWKDMRWRGSVKVRHFVTGLKDYYVEKAARCSGSLMGPGSWAVKYINTGRSRNILEAFDGDASGFVTVNEVNNFTQSRPLNWSLPHWIAYWAIGWQMTCTTYCIQIEELFDAMTCLAHEVLPENRPAVDNYINTAWRLIAVFVQSIKREEGTEELRSKFGSYVAAEEARLRRNFEDIKYRVEDSDTLRIIAGGDRIETTVFPMFYLALKRGLDNIGLAREYVLSYRQLSEAFLTIHSIAGAALDRIKNLRSIFEQQNLEVKAQFKIFASGLYNISSIRRVTADWDRLRELQDPIPCSDEMIRDHSISLSVLDHPPVKMHEINFTAYDPPESTPLVTEGAPPLLGVYYGFIYREGRPMDPMIKFTLSKGEAEHAFIAAGAHYRGSRYKHCKIAGNWSPLLEDGKIPVEIKITYRSGDWADTELRGAFDPEENSLRGTMIMPARGFTGEFVFKRDPNFVRFYPAPSTINARKRWEFAITSVLDLTRRQAWSSDHILKRFSDGKRYMGFTLRGYYGRRLTKAEEEEYRSLFPSIYEADAQLYASLINAKLRQTPIFSLIFCCHCGSTPGGSMIVCIDCRSEATTVDLCSEPECINSTITFEAADRKAHLSTHVMFKVHRLIFDRDVARIESFAKDTLNSARGIISRLKEDGEPMPDCVQCKTGVSFPCWCCTECTGKKFICDRCEHEQLAFSETHTKMHTIVRVSEKVEEGGTSTEERLRLVEDKLENMMRILEKLVEKSAGGSQSAPFAE